MYFYIYICIVKRIKWFSHILKQTETFATVHCSYHNGTQAKRMDSLVHLDNTKKKSSTRWMYASKHMFDYYVCNPLHTQIFCMCLYNSNSRCKHMDCTQL